MIHRQFVDRVKEIVWQDATITGLAIGGSWLSGDIDEFSDLDLVLFTGEKISDHKEKMLAYAQTFGNLLNAFTGEHVGEPRLLICLYDDPLLHVDIKFLVKDEFYERVENPDLVFDRTGELERIISESEAKFPYPDYQWIEDRFWTWVHYVSQKIGRGEYTEANDSLGFLRSVVLGPLLHISNGNLPRGVRKVEWQLPADDVKSLHKTIASFNQTALFEGLTEAVNLYRQLRKAIYPASIRLQQKTEQTVMHYLDKLKLRG